jgi:hypothetical protein
MIFAVAIIGVTISMIYVFYAQKNKKGKSNTSGGDSSDNGKTDSDAEIFGPANPDSIGEIPLDFEIVNQDETKGQPLNSNQEHVEQKPTY